VTGVNADGSANIEQYNATPYAYSTQNGIRAEKYLHIADASSGRNNVAWLQGSTLYKFSGNDLHEAGHAGGIGTPDWAGAGDYDRDGAEDLFWYHGGSNGSIYVLRSTGVSESAFQSLGAIRGPGIGAPTWAATGDFNGDGHRNEIAWLQGTTLFMFAGSNLGMVSSTTVAGTPNWGGVGDYDGDGKDDLFWFYGGTDGSIYRLMSTGTSFGAATRIRGPGLGTPSWAGVGNFTGSGPKRDIVWLQGSMLYTFCGQQLLNCGSTSGISAPTWAAVVNRTGDQRDDLLWFHGGTDGSFYGLEMGPGNNNFLSNGTIRGPGVGTPLVAVSGGF
jgi:hypothetical protein